MDPVAGKLATKDVTNACSNQDSLLVNAGEVLNLDEIRSITESKHKDDAEITKLDSKTKAQELQAMRKPIEKRQKMAGHIETEQKKKDHELMHMNEKTEREAKRIETENKRLKKHQEQVEKAKKRKEKEEAELKRKASIQKQANLMERFLKGKTNRDMESSGSHHMDRTTCSKLSGNIDELAVAATSAMDCTLSEENRLSVEEFRMAHVAKWRKLSQHNRLCHWGVRRSPKIQLFPELRLQKSSSALTSHSMSTPTTKEQSSQESTGNLDFTKLLDELETPSQSQNSIPSSVLLVKKLLQFDKSSRPAYYGTWRKTSSTVSARQPFQRDQELNYDVESDEEWEQEDQEDPERLSDFEEDDEKTMNEHDSKIDAEEETENSFLVPNDYLSDNEVMKCEPEISSMLSTPGIIVEELTTLQERQKDLHIITEYALKKERPLVISNLDHRKLDLLNAEDITGMLKVEKVCLQALCMKKYPGSPIIDVPVDVNITIEDELCQSNKKSPRTPVPSKAISDSDMHEFVKVVASCPQGMVKLVELLHETFPCVSKAQLKNKVREIADFTNNHWQVKKDILDRYSLSLSPDKGESPKCEALCSSQQRQAPKEPGKTSESSPQCSLK